MKFDEVKPALFAGAKVRRAAWPSHMYWVEEKGDTALVVPSDLKAGDWEVHVSVNRAESHDLQALAPWVDIVQLIHTKGTKATLVIK